MQNCKYKNSFFLLFILNKKYIYFKITNDKLKSNGDGRKNYNVGVLKHVQAIFAHLGHSALQFYVPRGLWGHFK